jgi:SH3-like domain-containing protein
MKKLLLVFLILFFQTGEQFAENQKKLSLPRFASLRSAKVNIHVGPGNEYPVEWTLILKGLPVLIVAEFNQWRRVEVFDGTIGWIHKTLLSSKKTKILIKDVIMFAKSSQKSQKIAKICKGAVLEEIKEKKGWLKCYARTDKNQKIIGWVESKNFWHGEKIEEG